MNARESDLSTNSDSNKEEKDSKDCMDVKDNGDHRAVDLPQGSK